MGIATKYAQGPRIAVAYAIQTNFWATKSLDISDPIFSRGLYADER
jgi:hypothetical protein